MNLPRGFSYAVGSAGGASVTATRSLMVGGTPASIVALASATTPTFVTTDVAIAPEALQTAVKRIGGDVRALASGLAGNATLDESHADFAAFEEALRGACADAARAIAEPAAAVAGAAAAESDERLAQASPAFKRALLVEALSYIAKFAGKRAVIKYGGAAMVQDALKASFANDVNLLRTAGLLPIVVHGGGPEITRTLEKLGGGSREFVDGVRVTDASDVKVVEMVLTGKVNTEIVSLLNQVSARAVGLSGKDAGLLRAKKLLGEGGRDLGRVGEITHVNHEIVEVLLAKEYVPVISPVGLGEDGEGYNINADAAAAEIAVALRADKLIYLTDVPGILEDGELIPEIGVNALRAKIASGVVRGGMVAKVKSVLRALERGVESVHIIDGRTPHSLIAELFTDRGVGTLIRRD